MSTKAIPPGGEGEIKATLRTSGRTGSLSKRVTVVSNDPKTPRLVLTLQGEIVVDVTVTPKRLYFGDLKKRQNATRDLETVVNAPDKVKVVSVTIEDNRFELLQKSVDKKGNAIYEVSFLGAQEIGRIKAAIRIKLEGSSQPFIEVPVMVNVVSNLRYANNIYFFKDDGGFKSRDIVISSRASDPVTVTTIKDPDKLLKVEIAKNKSSRVRIKASVLDPKAKYEKGKRHKLLIGTNDKDEPVVEIEYMISDESRSGKASAFKRATGRSLAKRRQEARGRQVKKDQKAGTSGE